MIGYQDKINQILRGAETIKNSKDNNMNCPYDYDNPEFRLEWFEDRLEKVELERDSLEAKVWELERMLNEQEDVNKQLRQWKEEALKVMNQWNEVSDYINLNAEVEDLGRFVPQICLKYLKERDNVLEELLELLK